MADGESGHAEVSERSGRIVGSARIMPRVSIMEAVKQGAARATGHGTWAPPSAVGRKSCVRLVGSNSRAGLERAKSLATDLMYVSREARACGRAMEGG